jgi:23S rRNA (guanosine2251-2'-O)-methyltransferase
MSKPRDIRLIVHNVRSIHNVGSLLRTADGLGISHVYLTGYTPYPMQEHDERLPHIASKITRQLHKTALGAELSDSMTRDENCTEVIRQLQKGGFTVAALEQTPSSVSLSSFSVPDKLAVIVGREVEGIEQSILDKCDVALEIPMLGQKESFNVSVAGGMALYHCRFYT